MAAPAIYTPLEPELEATIGGGASFTTASIPTFFTSASFVYTFAFVVIVVAASFRYAYAGALRMSATQKGIQESKGEFKRVTYGLLGVFALWLILYTVNKDMLTGNVSLSGLKVGNVVGNPGALSTVVPKSTGSTGSIPQGKCLSLPDTKAALSAGDICASSACSTFSDCTYSSYESVIQQEASAAGVNPNIVKVIICKESRGKQKIQNSGNTNGTYDCGLMQINQIGLCTDASYDIQSNIHSGVALIKAKLSAASGGVVYPGISPIAKMFASYGCCGSGINPNSASVDCTTATGYPFTPPKWACPENPGDTAANMCSVRADVCGAMACLKMLGN